MPRRRPPPRPRVDPFNPEVSPVMLETHNGTSGQRLARTDPRGLVPGRRAAEFAARFHRPGQDRARGVVQGQERFSHRRFSRTRIIVPYGDEADLTYYKPRTKDELLPPPGHFQEEWFNACRAT